MTTDDKTQKKEFYKKINAELAAKYKTSATYIDYIRKVAAFDHTYTLPTFTAKVVVHLHNIEKTIAAMRASNERRRLLMMDGKDPKHQKEMILKTEDGLKFAMDKKGLILGVYMLVGRLRDEEWGDITRSIPYEQL